jgi:PAS domain S-box-containing protein
VNDLLKTDTMDSRHTAPPLDFLAGGGLMSEKIRAYDWSATSLGPLESWPQSLKIAAAMILGSKFPACIVWGPSLTTIYNDAFRPILGAKAEALGRPFDDVWSEAWDTLAPIARRALAGESTFIEHFPLVVERNGYPEEAYFTFSYSPIRDETGTIVGFLDTVIETTTEVNTRAAIHESEARFHNLADNIPVMIWVTEPNGSCSYLSRSWYEFTGQTPETGLGAGWLEAVHPEDRPGARSTFHAALAARKAFQLEYRLLRRDGEYRWAIDAATPRFGNDGSFLGHVGSVLDIDERKRWEDHQQLLINELNHRVKNTLTIVQAIANQSFKGERSDPETRMTFEGRLFALAKAHDVLTRENWESADLHEIIAEVITPYTQQSGNRFTIDGPHLRLAPSMAVSLAMAIHELATNAAKYGALSVASGRVTIRWMVEHADTERLVLRWEEKGGPPVSPPTRKGFGTRLIERSLAQELSGDVQLRYESSGLVCIVNAPMFTEEADRRL